MNPTGTFPITENGTYDVKQYEYAEVNVPMPTGNVNLTIEADGDWVENVANYATATVKIAAFTEIEIDLEEGMLSPTLAIAADPNARIYWGDKRNGAYEVVIISGSTLASLVRTWHTYAKPGRYVITIKQWHDTDQMKIFSDTTYSKLLHDRDALDSRAYQNSIKAVRIGNDYVKIGDYAFAQCYSLEKATLPDSLTSIGTYTFAYCYALKSVHLPNSLAGTMTGTFQSCNSLSEVTIPSGVTGIGDKAFQGCYSLKSITIPSGVTTIGNYAFDSCSELTSVTIPSTVTGIGGNAFNYCYSLTELTIPSGVTSIGSKAFANNYGMASYHFKSTTPPTLADTAVFNAIPSDCKIYVPSSKVSTYKAADKWSTYASQIYGE